MNSIDWSTGFQKLVHEPAALCHIRHLLKIQISEYLPDPNGSEWGGAYRGGAGAIGTSVLTNVPDDSDTQSDLRTTALDSCLVMLLTIWKLNVIKVTEVGREVCKNSDHIFHS